MVVEGGCFVLQETRWKDEGTKFNGVKGRRNKMWWNRENRHGGIWVMLKENMVEKVLAVR